MASGLNAAKPHAKPTQRKIKPNDLVVVDFGVIYRGYHSDMTRTRVIGKLNPKMKKLYRAVKLAQGEAIKKAKPGLRIADLVKGAHGILRRKGFGKYIMHSLGHGVGKKIHEPPKLSEKNKRCLKERMVITIEPGLYIKGVGGVRIEDMICLTRHGSKVLTR